MKKFTFLKIIPIVLTITILLPVCFSGQALGWSAVRAINWTHGDIDDAAYEILSNDPAFGNVNFPMIAAIKEYDYVNTDRTGTGPDVVGSTNCGDHYYNPRLEAVQSELAVPGAGGGLDMVEKQFNKLVEALNSGDADKAAHAAAWAAHFAADLYTPYHTQGTYREDIIKRYNDAGGANAATIPLPFYITGSGVLSGPVLNHPNDWKEEIEAWMQASRGNEATEDWFDPWYWDGVGDELVSSASMLESSHVVYEGISWGIPGSWTAILSQLDFSGAVTSYSDMWVNPEPSFTNSASRQAAKVREFARKVALVTQQMVDSTDRSIASIATSSTPYLRGAIESAATVWRASFSALAPSLDFSIPDKDEPQKIKVEGLVTNTANEPAQDVQIKLTVTGGTVKSGDTSTSAGTIGSGYQRNYTWEIETTQLGYCTIKLEVIGKYVDTPDMQYAVTEVTVPGVLPITSGVTPADRDHSIVFCLDNSGSMKGQPIIDAMNAGVKAVDAAEYAGVEMALFFFGVSGCDPAQCIVEFTVNRERVKSAIKTASARGDTPLAETITIAGEYIRSNARGEGATIILLTDGKETCGGDPLAAARALNPNLKLKTSRSWFATPAYASNDIPIKLQVVGFNLDASTARYLEQVAEAGNGGYYAAANVEELTEALTTIVKEASKKGIEVQVWWLVVGGIIILLVIILLLRRRRTPVPVPTTASTSAAVATPPQAVQPPAGAPPAALFCRNCGARIPAGAAFCTGCGNSVTSVAPPVATRPEPSQTYCTQCGSPNALDNTYCGKCGSPLATDTRSKVAEKTSPQVAAFCPRCGTPVVPESDFCNKCGSPLAESVPPPKVNRVAARNVTYCPQCGSPNGVGSAFCNKCGTTMAIQPSGQAQASKQPAAESAIPVSGFWWILPFLFLLPGGIYAWISLKDRNKKTARGILMVSITWSLFILVSYLTNAF